MPGRTLHRLSPRRIATERKRGRYADGGGLYLQVSEEGTKSWLFRFTQGDKARQMGLGAVHTISLPPSFRKGHEGRWSIRPDLPRPAVHGGDKAGGGRVLLEGDRRRHRAQEPRHDREVHQRRRPEAFSRGRDPAP